MSQTMIYMLAAVIGEALLLLLVLLIVSYLRGAAQRRRDNQAAKALRVKLRQLKSEREQAVTKFLTAGAGLSGDGLDHARVAILRGEFGFLQRLAGIYRLRDADALARIDIDLFAALEPYHALSVEGAAVGNAAESDVDGVDQADLEFLRKENKRLSGELTITMETMSRMLNEYSTMFGGGDAGKAASIGAGVAVPETAAEVQQDNAAASAWDDGDVEIADNDIEVASVEPSADADAPDQPEPFEDLQPAGSDDDVLIDEAVAIEDAADELFDVAVADDSDAEIEISGQADAGETQPGVDEPEPEAPEDAIDIAVAAEPDVEADSEPRAEDIEEVFDEVVDDDPIAAILREAQSQEASARGRNDVADGRGDPGGLVEDGPSEVVALEVDAADDVMDIDDLDDLFDDIEPEDKAKARSSQGSA